MKSLFVALMFVPVILRAQCSDSVSIAITGGVRNPGFYVVKSSETFPQIIMHAGGLTNTAGLNDITVRRYGEATKRPEEVLAAITENTPSCIHDGDEILVRNFIPANAGWRDKLQFVSLGGTLVILVKTILK